jgi:hypothetical protein
LLRENGQLSIVEISISSVRVTSLKQPHLLEDNVSLLLKETFGGFSFQLEVGEFFAHTTSNWTPASALSEDSRIAPLISPMKVQAQIHVWVQFAHVFTEISTFGVNLEPLKLQQRQQQFVS